MEIMVDEKDNSKVAVIQSDETLIASIQDALDLMASVRYLHDCHKMVIKKEALTEDFFNLKTKLAGDILQKYTNYKVKLAIVGDFSGYQSKSLQDFIRESNAGNQVLFIPTVEIALKWLHAME
jgi:hypothetical protein